MKTTNAKEMMKEYDSMSFNAVGFGSWLMGIKDFIKFHSINSDGEYLYSHKKFDTLYTMKQLYELYMYENNKNYIHK